MKYSSADKGHYDADPVARTGSRDMTHLSGCWYVATRMKILDKFLTEIE